MVFCFYKHHTGLYMELYNYLKKLYKVTSIDKKKYIFNQIGCFICLSIYTVSSVVFPSFLSKIIDIGILNNDIKSAIMYIVEMLLCGVIMIIFFYFQKISFFKFGNDIVLDTKKKLYYKLNNVNLAFWGKHKIGNILTILDKDISQMQELLTTNISELVVNSFLCIGITIYILYLNLTLGIVMILLSIVFAILQRYISNKSRKKMGDLRALTGEVNSFTTETINNMPALQMTGNNKYIRQIYEKNCEKMALKGLSFVKTMSYVSITGMTFNILAIIFTLFIGAFEVSRNRLSVGLLFSLTIYVQRLYSPIVATGNIFVKIKNFYPLLDNIYDVMFTDETIMSGAYKKEYKVKGNITFQNVWYRYDRSGEYVLKNFSDEFKNGEIIGIIGENGSGKTTLVRLLTKLCNTESGDIRIDGIDIKMYDFDYLQEQIGVMTQDSYILPEEINELLGNDKYKKQLQEYLELMNLSDSGTGILNDEFEFKENKLNVSGGEAQKLALFRLFLERKPIYILDEPTASLDPISEERLINFIKNNFKACTTIIITHKPQILDICTKVIQMK